MLYIILSLVLIDLGVPSLIVQAQGITSTIDSKSTVVETPKTVVFNGEFSENGPVFTIDVGENRKSSVIPLEIRIESKFDVPLEFQTATSCSCLKLPKVVSMGPKDPLVLKVEVKLPPVHEQFVSSMKFYSSELDHSFLVHVKGKACGDVACTPSSLEVLGSDESTKIEINAVLPNVELRNCSFRLAEGTLKTVESKLSGNSVAAVLKIVPPENQAVTEDQLEIVATDASGKLLDSVSVVVHYPDRLKVQPHIVLFRKVTDKRWTSTISISGSMIGNSVKKELLHLAIKELDMVSLSVERLLVRDRRLILFLAMEIEGNEDRLASSESEHALRLEYDASADGAGWGIDIPIRLFHSN